MKRLHCDFCGVEIDRSYQGMFGVWDGEDYRQIDSCLKCSRYLGEVATKLEKYNELRKTNEVISALGKDIINNNLATGESNY